LSTKVTAPIYVNSTIFLFLGGFIIALTMEKWNLHKRIALLIIRTIGSGPSRIVLGFMVAAGFLSMWISNTATVIMMLPIGMAIISKMESEFGAEETHKLTLGLMLGIAYACSVGGMATLVGTPPNLAFARIFSITFPTAKPIAFGSWFFLALPLSAVFMVVIWSIFTKILYRVPAHVTIDRSIVEKEYRALGRMSYESETDRRRHRGAVHGHAYVFYPHAQRGCRYRHPYRGGSMLSTKCRGALLSFLVAVLLWPRVSRRPGSPR
jgi:sodium-dependent dicarboxylate transporter 2/3/5